MAYDGVNIKDLNTSTPTEGSSYIPELNDSDREIKRVLKNQFAITTKNTDYTLTAQDSVVVATASGITLKLPAASSVAGGGYLKHYIIKNSSSGSITISGVIDGQSGLTLVAGELIIIVTDGSSYWKSNPLTPISHASSHQAGGSDAIKLDDLAAPDDNTDLDVSTSAHGLCPKAPNDTTKFLRGDGTWAEPPGSDLTKNSYASNSVRYSVNDILNITWSTYQLGRQIKYTGSTATKSLRIGLTILVNYKCKVYVSIRKNGVEVMEEFCVGVDFEGNTQDVYYDFTSLSPNDTIEIYTKRTAGSYFCAVTNIALMYDFAIYAFGDDELESYLPLTWKSGYALSFTTLV